MMLTRLITAHGKMQVPWKLRTILAAEMEVQDVEATHCNIDYEKYVKQRLAREIAEKLTDFIAEGSPEPLMYLPVNEVIPANYPFGKVYIRCICVYEPDNDSPYMKYKDLPPARIELGQC